MEKEKKKGMNVKMFVFVAVTGALIGSVLAALAAVDAEPVKSDGFLYLEILNDKFEIQVGHQKAVEICRNEQENFECEDVFYGCGAFNCRCKLKSLRGRDTA